MAEGLRFVYKGTSRVGLVSRMVGRFILADSGVFEFTPDQKGTEYIWLGGKSFRLDKMSDVQPLPATEVAARLDNAHEEALAEAPDRAKKAELRAQYRAEKARLMANGASELSASMTAESSVYGWSD